MPQADQPLADALSRAAKLLGKRKLLGQRWWHWASGEIQRLPAEQQAPVLCAISFARGHSAP